MDLLNNDPEVLEAYSTDASVFKVRPKWVATPESVEDIQRLVAYAREHGESLTARAGGSDMSGGPLSESIVVDVKNFNKIGEVREEGTIVGPGVFYRDFELKTLEKGLILPCYTASKNLAAIGGMVGNNCGGEMSLRYGKMEEFIVESKWIFADGKEYAIKRGAVDNEYSQKVLDLLKRHEALIKAAKPKVSKNSAGYYLWNVWDGETFDLNKLLVGSQGTLGIMTEATLSLVPVKTHHDLITIFFKSWDELPATVNAILPYKPESLETFDRETIKLGLRFLPEIAKKAHSGLLAFATNFIPEAVIGLRLGGLPELVVLVEVAESSEKEVKAKVAQIVEAIKPLGIIHRTVEKDSEEEKFWVMRRESFNLLRQHVHGKRTVPVVDDFCIPPEKVPEFLPKARAILEKYGIKVNIAGHAGNGNFHIIPLMDLREESERAKLIPMAQEFYALVAEYKGTTTGEHNDGIVRTPFLHTMYSPEILALFKEVKNIFDPQNIFNPGKKVDGTLDDFKKWLA